MKSMLSLFIMTLLICSCKKELEPQTSSEAATTPVADAAAAGTPAVSTTVTPSNQPQSVPGAMPSQPVAVQQQHPAKTAPGMNPPHGQPNHRCDITVGAPLNSPPGKTAGQQMQKVTSIDPSKQPAQSQNSVTPTITTSQSSPAISTPTLLDPAKAPAPTAPGMNPPHGQDGHKCDIAVGAPLPK